MKLGARLAIAKTFADLNIWLAEPVADEIYDG